MPVNDKQHIHVVAGIINNRDGQILIARRPIHLDQGGLWEFPGGKRELAETDELALARELQEELGVTAIKITPVARITHEYPHKIVNLVFFEVADWAGEPQGLEGQEIRWVSRTDLAGFSFPAANKIALKAIKFPRLMAITPEFSDEGRFLSQLEKNLQAGIKCVQLRCKDASLTTYRRLAERVTQIIQRYDALLMLNTVPEMLADFPDAGLHISSRVLATLQERPCDENRRLTSACHNRAELDKATGINVDAVLLSPIEPSLSHPDQTPLGWSECESLGAQAGIPIFALGGLNIKQLPQALSRGCYGLAAIRGLWTGQSQASIQRVLAEVLRKI